MRALLRDARSRASRRHEEPPRMPPRGAGASRHLPRWAAGGLDRAELPVTCESRSEADETARGIPRSLERSPCDARIRHRCGRCSLRDPLAGDRRDQGWWTAPRCLVASSDSTSRPADRGAGHEGRRPSPPSSDQRQTSVVPGPLSAQDARPKAVSPHAPAAADAWSPSTTVASTGASAATTG